jgi:hypothetical protein
MPKGKGGKKRVEVAPAVRAANGAESCSTSSINKKKKRKISFQEPVVEGGAPAASTGKDNALDELDDIFSQVKESKKNKAKEEEERKEAKRRAKEDREKRSINPYSLEGGGNASSKWAWADSVRPLRVDNEGLPIYSWESLRIGQGGGTALCPFDCDCCF